MVTRQSVRSILHLFARVHRGGCARPLANPLRRTKGARPSCRIDLSDERAHANQAPFPSSRTRYPGPHHRFRSDDGSIPQSIGDGAFGNWRPWVNPCAGSAQRSRARSIANLPAVHCHVSAGDDRQGSVPGCCRRERCFEFCSHVFKDFNRGFALRHFWG